MGDFSDNVVNQRFNRVFQELEKYNLIKGKSDLAKKLGTYNHVINSILKGQRNITVDQLQKLFLSYGVDANYIFGAGNSIFMDGYPAYGEIPTRSITDREMGGRENITLVPAKALAGYATEMQDDKFLDNLQKFSIPNMAGELMAFEINGDSMTPTITNGDIVVCEATERGEPLRDNHVYVIVTDVVVAKRIQQVRESNTVTRLNLISDNDAVYKPYPVELEEVRQILKVKCRLTSYAIS